MQNYFKIFEIEENIEINLNDLEKKYFEFQKNFHPDKAGIAEIEKSILINEAYEVLKNKVLRASHILQIHNIDVENDEKSIKVNQETLMEIFTLQEEISDNNQEKNSELKNLLQEKIEENFCKVKEEIAKKNYEIAAQNLIKIKYYSKTLKDLKK